MSKLKRGIKKINWKLNDALFSLRVKGLPQSSSGRRIIIYHGVTKSANKALNARFISTKEFEQQVAFFSTHFNVVPLDEYFKGASHSNKLTVALTFDDGYLNNLNEALPILEKYKVPASFFITTIRQAGQEFLWADLLDLHRYTGPEKFEFNATVYTKGKHEYSSDSITLKQFLKAGDWATKELLCKTILKNNRFTDIPSFDPYYQLMNEEQIRTLAASDYATIGSHGLYHNCLTEVSSVVAQKELKLSKQYLENLIQQEVRSFAYPDGSYNLDLVQQAKQVGYTQQLLVDFTKPTHEQDEALQARFGINPYISFNNQVQCIINGHY